MIGRVLAFILLTGLAVAGAVWLADRPGEVIIRWEGWRIDTSLPVLLMALAALWAVLWAVSRLVRLVLGGPGRLLDWWRGHRRHQGYDALAQGLNALAAGDGRKARALARRADRLLGQPDLAGLLTAQAARLGVTGPDVDARLAQLAAHPATRLAGLSGQLDLAQGRQDWQAAYPLAQSLWDDGGRGASLIHALVLLCARHQDWDKALAVLADKRARQDLSGADLLELKSLALLGAAGQAGQNPDRAADHALAAHRADPFWVPAAAAAARGLAHRGKIAKAEKLLAQVWRHNPHPDLARAWAELLPAEAPLKRVKRMERLVEMTPDSSFAHLALAQAALAAKLWGVARGHAERAAGLRPSRAAYCVLDQVMCQEQGLSHSPWADKAQDAAADPAWVCGHCQEKAEGWAVNCPSCGQPGGLDWHA